MKFRGPSSSLNPARESARAQARAATMARHPTSAGGGPHTFAASTGWSFTTDEHGRLIAVHDETGTSTVIATPEGEQHG